MPVLVGPGKRGGWGPRVWGRLGPRSRSSSGGAGCWEPGLLGLKTRTPVLEEGKTRGLLSWVTRSETASAPWKWGRRPGVARSQIQGRGRLGTFIHYRLSAPLPASQTLPPCLPLGPTGSSSSCHCCCCVPCWLCPWSGGCPRRRSPRPRAR